MTVQVHKCKNIIHPFPILAWAIMLFQGMNPFNKKSWAHMAMSFTFPDGTRNYYDVTSKGCKMYTEELFTKMYKIQGTHTLKQHRNFVEFHDWFKLMEGREYDTKQLIGLLLKSLNLVSFNTIGHNYKKLICSELILNYLQFFYKIQVKDSDNFDLMSTWNKVKEF